MIVNTDCETDGSFAALVPSPSAAVVAGSGAETELKAYVVNSTEANEL